MMMNRFEEEEKRGKNAANTRREAKELGEHQVKEAKGTKVLKKEFGNC